MNFPCTNCNNVFKNKPSFSNHLKNCLVAQIQLNQSSDQIFETETPTTRVPTKQMQQSSAITANKPRVICHKCQNTFENHGRLLNHEKTCQVGNKTSGSFFQPGELKKSHISSDKLALPDSQSQPREELKVSPNKSFASAVVGNSSISINKEVHYVANSLSSKLSTSATKANRTPPIIPDKRVSEIKRTQIKKKSPASPQESTVTQPSAVFTAGDAYEEIVKWKRNIFKLPKGNNGKRFLDEMTKLINQWASTNDEDNLKLLMILPSLLLQRTSKGVKARVNKDHLQRRLDMWDEKKIEDLVKEGKIVQSRFNVDNNGRVEEDMVKSFRNLMINGKVNAALRLLDKSSNKGILPMNRETIEQLHEKHPKGKPLYEELIMEGPINEVNPVIFDTIDADLVQKIALRTKGAAGPSGFDADDWRGVLGSRIYGKSSDDLCTAIANMTRKMCTENRITQDGGITPLMACRLIPLDKDPGLRPIGIGEVLRRIIGKMVVQTLKPDLQEGAGDIQMCVGQEGGCEAGVHAMYDLYQEQNTHGIIQVDANNAFNVINRKVFLHNVQIICPEISTFVRNCYLKPARLFVVGGIEIASEEGTTQGDPSAMPTYALGILPLLICLSQPEVKEEKVKQAAYADDLAGCGTIDQLKVWWKLIIEFGPFIGYYAKPTKSWLIVKPEHVEYAMDIFEGTDIRITTDGKRHLGAVIGTEIFKDEYVSGKVSEWIDQLIELEKVAKVDPHVAYCAYVHGLQNRYTYVLRTIPNLQKHLKRLDEAIDKYLIRHLIKDHSVSELERLWLSLPSRMGGLGMNIISEIAPYCYQNSRRMTEVLVEGILNQHNLEYERKPNNSKQVKAIIAEEKKKRENEKFEKVKSNLNPRQLKLLEAVTEKGASSWLNALPLKEHNFYLDKQTFWDTIHLRYGLDLARLPTKCVCNQSYSVEHALNCKRGGFISTRHNEVRDFTAELLSETCSDVSVEPLLTPLTGEIFQYKTANRDDHARLDVSARDVWIRGGKAYFDVKVFNPLAQSYSNQTLKAAHRSNEKSKKRNYVERILEVQHGTFTPLVFTCLGGMSIECAHFYNRLAEKISEKRNISIGKARTWVRTKLIFSLLRSTNLCIRGSRTRKQFAHNRLADTDIQISMEEADIQEIREE